MRINHLQQASPITLRMGLLRSPTQLVQRKLYSQEHLVTRSKVLSSFKKLKILMTCTEFESPSPSPTLIHTMRNPTSLTVLWGTKKTKMAPTKRTSKRPKTRLPKPMVRRLNPKKSLSKLELASSSRSQGRVPFQSRPPPKTAKS